MQNGYIRVRIAPNDWRYEHRLVWEEAHGPIPEGHHVHHVNHDPTDNRLENLRLVLGRDHNQHHTSERHATGQLDNRGDASGRWLHDLDDAEIVRRRESGESFRGIGRDLGHHHDVISNHYRRAKERQESA